MKNLSSWGLLRWLPRPLAALGLLLATAGAAQAQTAPTFAPVALYNMGGNPVGPQLVDINGDGFRDLLTANYSNSTLGVRLGTGTGTLGAVATYACGGQPLGLAAGYLNNDNKLDVVLANYSGSQVSVLLGTGTGGFGAVTQFATGSQPYGVALGDVNGDGKLDAVTADYGSSKVGVLLGTGTGTFGAVTEYGAGGAPNAVAVGDVSGNGQLDVVVTNNNGSVGVLLGTGTGSLGTATVYSLGTNSSRGVALGDLNRDGRLDIVAAGNSTTPVAVLLNAGAGAFGTASRYAGSGAGDALGVALGDVNGDGFLDAAVARNGRNAVDVWPGTGTGTLGTATALTTDTSSPQDVAIGDLNNDGKPDVAAGEGNSLGTLLNAKVFLNATIFTAPTLTSLSPTSGPVGTSVTLTGTSLGGATAVRFNGTAATTFAVVNGTTITATVPAGATSGPVTVTTPSGTSGGVLFTVNTTAPTLTRPTANSTTSGQPVFEGTTPAGSTVTIYLVMGSSAAQAIGTATATGGNFSFVPGTALASGSYSVYATARLSGQAVSGNSNTITFTVDATPPTATLTTTAGSTTTTALIPFTVTFSEPVTGFSASSVTVTNGAVVSSGGPVGNAYSFNVRATAPGPVTVSVPAGVAQDAAGNDNTAAGPLSVTYSLPMSVAPVLLSPTSGSTTGSPLVIGGSAPTGSFVGITVTNLSNGASASRSTSATNNNFSSQFSLLSGTYQAVATAQQSGSQPASSAPITFTVDATQPTATISTTAGSSTSTAPIPFTVSFSEPVTGLSASSFAVSNGTVTSGPSSSGTSAYTFGVTPAANGPVTVSLAAGAVRDAVGNTNTASNSLSVTYAAPLTATTWTGAVSTDWFTAGNWSAGVPTATVDAIIPAGTPFAPLIAAGTAAAQTLTLASGATLTQRGGSLVVGDAVTNNGTITSSGGVLTAGGTVTNGGTFANTGGNIVVGGSFTSTGTVLGNGGSFTVGGSFTNRGASATLTLNSGSTLSLGGNFTNTGGTVDGSGTGRLALTGSVTQVVNGTLSTFPNLTVGTGTAFTTGPVRIRSTGSLTLNGNLSIGTGQPFTLLSDANGTAFVVNNGSAVVVGTATVQRYIDPSLNPGLGYRHYAAPVTNSTVADLATTSAAGGFAPTLNPAYNTSPTPSLVSPFPTVFGYDDARLGLANNLNSFDKGYFSPNALTDPLTPGRGYTVNLSARELVDFQGSLTSGDRSLSLTSSRNTYPDGGWQLLGNPYPAPLSYARVAAADRQGLEAAIYVYSSVSQYGGFFRSYVNGIGNPVLPVAQAFFVRVAAGQSAASLTFRNSQRLTEPNNTPFQRTAANVDARPLVQLELRPGTGNASTSAAADEFFAYAQADATPAFDAQLDAVKLPNPTGFHLASLSASGHPLAIDARPAFSASTALPLTLGVPAAGTYVLSAAALANLPAGLDAYLADDLTGQTLKLSPGTSYSFSVSAAQVAAGTGTGRFRLLFRPATALATAAPGLSAAEVALFPNPAHARFTVLLPGLGQATSVRAELLNALGQVVRRQAAALPASGTQLTFDAAELATGVYTLRLQAGTSSLAKRLVIE